MIKGRSINIRPLKEEDLDEFFSLRESIRLQFEFFPEDLGSEYTFKKNFYTTGFLEKNKGIFVIINTKNRIVGMLWYEAVSLPESFQIGFAIFQQEDRGKGYMKEALILFSSYLFNSYRYDRLQLLIPDYHRAAIAVAQKCGYSFEGILRKSAFFKGKQVDLCLYSLLRSECKNIEQVLQ